MVQQSDAAVVGPEDGLDAEVVRVWDPVLDGLAAVPRDRLGAALAVDAPVDGAHHGALEAFDLLDEAEAHRVLNDGELLELAAASARQAAAAHAHLLTWIARLATRPRMFTGAPIISPADATAAELQQRLGLGRRAAQRLVRDAHSLTGLLWPVHESLTAGLIDAGKASVFVDVLDTQPVASVAVVLEEVLPLAPGLSAHALRGRLCDALVHVDPDSAAERARTAATQRRVSHPRPHPDAMATFSAFLPAPTAHALDQVCESAARATPGAQRGGRTLEQLRADVLATLAEGALLTGTVGIAGTTSESFRFDPARARVRITATPTHQHGGRTPAPVDALSWEWDTPAGQSGRPNPYHRDREGRGDREGADGVGFAGDDGVGDHSGSASGGASASVSRCVPGVDVPELHGHGAYPPALLPALGAHAWIHLVPPVQLGDPPPPSPGYTPTAVLDTFVRHRDRTCQAPGCSVAARLCDLDHIAPWPTGTTSAENLRCLCRFHHTLKTHGGHHYDIRPDGTLVWTTATGQVLHRRPDGNTVIPGLPHPYPGLTPEHLDPHPPPRARTDTPATTAASGGRSGNDAVDADEAAAWANWVDDGAWADAAAHDMDDDDWADPTHEQPEPAEPTPDPDPLPTSRGLGFYTMHH